MRALLGVLIAAVLVATGCDGGSDRAATEPRPAAEAPKSAAPVPAGPTGAVEVEVTYAGPPVVETVAVNKDVAQCGREQQIAKVAVGPDHGLRDAVVSVIDGHGATTAKPRHEPVLDQKGCEFHPPVLAMMPGELEVLNSDGILHNIHTVSKVNPTVNKAQPKFKKSMTVEFPDPEIIHVRCDVHSWMEGWIVVMPHPYFAVTGDRGAARIENVPAGKQRIQVWHPVLGAQTREVEVTPGQTTRVTFALPVRQAAAPPAGSRQRG
jgi:hypothetical protein